MIKRAWYCPVCKKFDLADTKEAMAFPEHVPHRGFDIGSCKGTMVPLYEIEKTDKELRCPDLKRPMNLMKM